MQRLAIDIADRHSGLDPESTAISNERDSHTSCNPKPWILNRVQNDRMEAFAEKSLHRHSKPDPESTATSNKHVWLLISYLSVYRCYSKVSKMGNSQQKFNIQHLYHNNFISPKKR